MKDRPSYWQRRRQSLWLSALLLALVSTSSVAQERSPGPGQPAASHQATPPELATADGAASTEGAASTPTDPQRGAPGAIRINRASLPPAALRSLEALNVRGADLRDILRGIGMQHGLSVVVDDAVSGRVTAQLVDVPVIDALVFLCREHDLSLTQSGAIFRIGLPEPAAPLPEPPPPAPHVVVNDGRLSADLVGADVGATVRAIAVESGLNIIVRPGVRGSIHGTLQGTDLIVGVRALLENNGFALRERDGIYYVEATPTPTASAPPDAAGGPPPPPRASRGGSGLWISVTDTLTTLDVRDAPVADVLREVAAQADLNLVTYTEPEGQLTARARVRTVEEVFDVLFRGTNVTYRRVGDIYYVGEKSTAGIASTELVRLGHLKAEHVLELIPDVLKQHAAIHLVKEHNGLMVTATRDVLAEVERVVHELDHPTPQILIEALVVDFEASNLLELGATIGRDGERAASVRGAPFMWGDGPGQRGGFTLEGDGTDANGFIDHVRDLAGRFGKGDFINWIGRLPDDFYVRIQALAAEGKAEIRSRPQIATLNGHEASLSIGTSQYYILRTETPIQGQGQVIIQESERFEKIEANVTLWVLPWVNASGEVTAEIRPEFSTPVGTLDPQIPPTINSRILESTVRLRDGETIILGGLIQDADIVHYNKIPLLGDIPLLGWLFRNRSRERRKSELVIYLTPHVFYGDERDAAKWDGLRDEQGVRTPELEPSRGHLWNGVQPGRDSSLYTPPAEPAPLSGDDPAGNSTGDSAASGGNEAP